MNDAKRRRSQGGFADGAAVKEDPGFVVHIEVVPARDFHEQVVRVLAIDDGQSERSLAGLK